jgi:hypothetical protein
MARLTGSERSALPPQKFALPAKRAFPINDRGHDIAALRDVARSVNAGNTTPAQAQIVRQKASAALAASKSPKPAAPKSAMPKPAVPKKAAAPRPRRLHPAIDAIRNH